MNEWKKDKHAQRNYQFDILSLILADTNVATTGKPFSQEKRAKGLSKD